jgi:prepilin-type N-terminal cleavage/methylation domain-containing protein
MKRSPASYLRSQGGYTLIEVVITAAIGAVVMSALSSVVLTSFRATMTATSRVEASTQIRNFQFRAYDDFARSRLPTPSFCQSGCNPTQITLAGDQIMTPPATTQALTIVYQWDATTGFLDRTVSSAPAKHAATNVSAFEWHLEGNTVVVNLTVKVYDYSESQVLRFYPRVT